MTSHGRLAPGPASRGCARPGARAPRGRRRRARRARSAQRRERRRAVAVDEVGHDSARRRAAGRSSESSRRSPTEVAFTSSSAAPGSRAACDAELAREPLGRARRCGSRWPPRRPPGGAPTRRRAPRRRRRARAPWPATRLAERVEEARARRCCRRGSGRPRSKVSVFTAPIAAAVGDSSSASVVRGELVRDRHVGAAVAGAGEGAHRLGEQRRRHRQRQVAPVEPELAEGRVHHRRRAAVPDGEAEDARERGQHFVGDLPPRASRARL